MKRVCVFTGTRAEYGLLAGLMKAIQSDTDLELRLVVSGSHLSPDHGMTCREIEEDGFLIDEKVEVLLSSDSATGISRSMGLGLMGYSDAINRIKPDVAVILGDRYEALAFAIAAVLVQVPILHIHGGEASFGSIDDSFRHCITKLSHLHCVCAETYRSRVVQLGENPETVFNVGSLGVENIKKIKLLSEAELCKILGFQDRSPYFLITFHPDAVSAERTSDQFEELLAALCHPAFYEYKLVFTHANSDANGQIINQRIKSFVSDHPHRAVSFVSMGKLRYLSALKHTAAVVGNSSSGILEAPGFKTPVVNIGSRQDGRIRSDNVIDCIPDAEAIVMAVKKAVSKPFVSSLSSMKNPFEKENTAGQIRDLIHETDFEKIGYKQFFDLPHTFFEERKK